MQDKEETVLKILQEELKFMEEHAEEIKEVALKLALFFRDEAVTPQMAIGAMIFVQQQIHGQRIDDERNSNGNNNYN